MQIDVTTMVVLTLGGIAVYIAYKKPDLGAAIGIGALIVTLLVLLLPGHENEHEGPKSCDRLQSHSTCQMYGPG